MKSIFEMTNNPENIIVSTSERFLKPTARVVSKNVLQSVVSRKCDEFINGRCNECFTNDKEVNCLEAWFLTKGKGKKIY